MNERITQLNHELGTLLAIIQHDLADDKFNRLKSDLDRATKIADAIVAESEKA